MVAPMFAYNSPLPNVFNESATTCFSDLRETFFEILFTLPYKINFMDWPLISIISVKYPKDNLWTCMCRVKLLKCKKKYQILWAHVSLLKYSIFWRENVQYYSDTKFYQGGLQWTDPWLVVSFYLSYLWHRQLQNKAIFFVIGSKSRPIYYFLCLPNQI